MSNMRSVKLCFRLDLPVFKGLLLCLSLLMALSATSQEAASKLPDAPSQTAASQQSAAAESGKAGGIVDVLTKQSLFFPNLATSTHRLSTGDKFKLFMGNSVSGSAFLGSLMGAGFGQAFNSPEGYGQGGEGYAKRFGASMARNASAQFFGTFMLASMMHQDPRFFVEPTDSFKVAVGHSLRRVFITRSDAGPDVTNWSGLLGPLLGEGLANAYMPPDAQTVGKTFQRYGTDIGVAAGMNVLRQYWPTLLRMAHLERRGATTTAPAPGGTTQPKPN